MSSKQTSHTETPTEDKHEPAPHAEHEPAVRHAPPSPPVRAAVKLRKFEAPPELAEKFGVTTHSEEFVSGVVKTADVRDLLDAFGLQDRSEIVFPFQHMKRQHGEIWSMRVEPPASHMVDGQPVIAHAWTFQQSLPERVAGVQ
jgi:hypothetical protein